MTTYRGFVEGKPIPQGSVSPIPYMKKGGGMGVSVFQKKDLLEWRDNIAEVFKHNYPDIKEVPFKKGTPVFVSLIFIFERPKSVSANKRPYMVVKPDTDKLVRSFGDAMTGVLYDDDSQIVSCLAIKKYAEFMPYKAGMFFEVSDEPLVDREG